VSGPGQGDGCARVATVRCADEAATHALGARLGRLARPGDAIALDGPLGAGKTVFSKGVGRGLGVPGRIHSPTFILLAVHEGGRLPLFHADLYRLGDVSELDVLGLEDAADGLLLVEWASLFDEALPADHLAVELIIDDDARDVHLRATGPRAAALLDRLLVGDGTDRG